MSKRNLYLNTTPVEEAVDLYMGTLEGFLERKTETVAVAESLGRITAEAVYAKCCSPLFNAAAMDGIAVRAAATTGASEANPLTLEEGRDYIEVDTGDPVHLP